MRTSANWNRAITHGVVSVKKGIIVAGTMSVKVAVAVWIIGPTGVAGTDKK
jgi:hypothetical protein